MRVFKTLLPLVVLALLAATVQAQDNKDQKPRRGPGAFGGAQMIDRILAAKDLNLTDEQKTKLEDLKKEYAPKLKNPMDGILTDEQKKARDDATKAAKDAGKNMRETFKAASEAVKLTDDQKAKLREAGKAMRPIFTELRDKINGILTSDQQEQVKKFFSGRKKAEKKE
ncbi:MAG: hypothetical protein ABSF26_02445 [Thermoguttaceae bacterium]|jgi:Spy/CpxP family protein refolding chaperone